MRYVSPALVLAAVSAAQPQGEVLWSFEASDGIYSTVALPDVDGDSLPDPVGVIYYGATPSDARKVYCLAGRTGETLWVSRTAYGSWGNKCLDVGSDYNRDGHADALLGTVGTYIPPGRSCIAIDGLTGANIWTYSRRDTWGWVYSVRRFVDVNADSVPDALCAAGGTTTDPSGHVVLVSGASGTPLWTYRVPSDGAQSVAPFVDLDGDTIPEVLVAAGGNGTDNHVYCVSGRSGAQHWSHLDSGSVSDVEMIPDINGSGTADCVAGGWDYCVCGIEGSTGARIWKRSLGSGNVVMELVPVRDVSGDGLADVVVGSWDSQVHVLSGADGSTFWSGPLRNDVWSVDTLADVTGDGLPEVVAGSLGDGNGEVKVFDGVSGAALWHYTFTERVYDVTGVPDVNGDGLPDVLVGLQDHDNLPDHLYCFSGLPPAGVTTGAGPGCGFSATAVACPGLAPELSFTAPAGLRYTVDVFDLVGRQVCPRRCGVTGSGITRLAATGGSSAHGVLVARVVLTDGRTTTCRLVIP